MSNNTPHAVLAGRPLTIDDYASGFDAESYSEHNYAHRILPEDAHFIDFITKTPVLDQLGVQPKSFKHVIDIGNAGVFIGPGLLAPFITDDGHLSLCDVGQPQLRTITRILKKGRRQNLGMWQKFEDKMAENELWHDAIARACALGTADYQDIFELESNQADAGSMFYVAESITPNRAECERAANCFLDAIRPNGLVIWAAMTGSDGYDTAGNTFSATWLDPQDMIDSAEDKVRNIRLTYTEASLGARGHSGPQYSGMALLVGVKR
jgi:hypothetical protein